MSEVLVEMWRGSFLECQHRGHAVIVNSRGDILESWGNPSKEILPRSACKILQAVPLVESGAADAYGLNLEHLALSCASHQGDSLHTQAVSKWLASLDLSEKDLRCGTHWPLGKETTNEMVRLGKEPCQIGCTLTCTFCHTGTQKLVRNLTPAEIVGQILIARDDLDEWGKDAGQKRNVSNIVLMGMGEPLYNTDNVRDAMLIAMDNEGIALSRRRITLSTSGVVPEIIRTGSEIGCMLAISFHATTDEVRDVLVPINRKHKIAELLEACRNYPKLSNSERITFEYVMLKNINDSDEDARRLVDLISGIPAKINLIPFNPWPGSGYERSDWNRIEAFGDIVNKAGYASPIRRPRGEDIMAACGQLKSETQRVRKSAKQMAEEVKGQ